MAPTATTNAKKIAILGAGPSGLVAAKEALENGLMPTILEKEAELGGVWNPITGCVWDTMHTNISKFSTSFGDFHWPQDTEMFPSIYSMFKYLNDYADKWKLKELIKFKSEVVKVSVINGTAAAVRNSAQGEDGWLVQWVEENESQKSEKFDGIIVATGIFAKPNIPKDSVKGLDTFPGQVIHSKEYKNASQFEGLRVLTIGGSLSGAEIATDVATNYAKSSIHCFREPFWILKRYLPDSSNNGANLPVDLIFYNRKFYANKKTLSIEEVNKNKNEFMLSFCKAQQDFKSLKVPLESFAKPINMVLSDQYLNQVEKNNLQPKNSNVTEIQGSKIIFQNGDVEVVDAIIFATGYKLDNSFFDKDVLEKISYNESDPIQPLILFEATVHPDLKNLFFVGMYKGPFFPVMEQQARWACRCLSGKVNLPPFDVILEGLKKEQAIRDQFPRPQFPHADYVFFTDTISKYGESLPDLEKLQLDNYSLSDALGKPLKGNAFRLEQRKAEISTRFMTEPVIPAHYNLVSDPIDTLNQMDFVGQVIKQFL